MTDTVYYRPASSYSYYPAALATRVVSIVIGVIEAVLLIRIAFELLAASAASPFVSWLYSVSGGLLGPFAGAFPNLALGGGSVLDVVAILGIIVYAVIGWIVSLVLASLFNAAVEA